MFTEEDIEELNTRLKRDGIDFETYLSDDGNSITTERLEFGGCEDQDGALRSVIEGYFRSKGQKITFEKGKVVSE